MSGLSLLRTSIRENYCKAGPMGNGKRTLQRSACPVSNSTASVPVEVATTTTMTSRANDAMDCPMCREYLDGPCGDQFQSWYDCTNRNEVDYVKQCKLQFETFLACLPPENDPADATSANGSKAAK